MGGIRAKGLVMETINCHDCRRFVSFSAARCPHCGSTEPAGPYQFSATDVRKFRIEQRNDNYLVRTALLIGFIGVLYGIVVGERSVSESGWHALQNSIVAMNAVLYGFLGILFAVPLAATLNLFRSARHFLIPVLAVILFLAYEFGFLRL
jgi:hypothetical protein